MDVSKKRVFMAGPIVGAPDWNREAFRSCERVLLALGAERVHNPTANAPIGDMGGRFPQPGFLRDELRELIRTRTTGRGMTRAHGCYDAMVLMPGWEEDDAAAVLYTVANALGMEVETWTMPNCEPEPTR